MTPPGPKRGESGSRKSEPALRLSLPELEAFLMVAKCGSFSEAASELNLTQPAVTARVQRLEAAVKTQLLERKPRGVTCTPAGQLLFDAGEAALRDLRQLANTLVQQAESQRNLVSVASTPYIASKFLSPLLRDFSRRSSVSVEVRDMEHSQVLAAVKEGAVDFAVTSMEGEDPTLATERFGNLSFVAVAPADCALADQERVTLEDLASFVIILLHDYARLNAQIKAEFDRRQLVMKSRMARNFTTVLSLVNSGLGVSFAPRTALNDSTYDNVRPLALEDFHYVRHFWLVRPANKPMRNAASAFWDFLRDAGPKD
jgi:DNA-binding transcriptional LysR family regulator